MKCRLIMTISLLSVFTIGLMSFSNNDISIENSVSLDANRVFFSPCGTLVNHQNNELIGDIFNGNRFFDYTYNWINESDTLVWGIDVKNSGDLRISPVLGVPDFQDGSVIDLIIGNEVRKITLKSTGGYERFVQQKSALFKIKSPGRYSVKMKIHSKKDASQQVAYVSSLSLSGAAAEGLLPVALRWRPVAVHCGWGNSENPAEIEMAIHEVTVVSDFIDSYSPITAPFGYFGSTWDAKNEKFGGINFSLWSFSAKTPPPATECFSHLIAVGEGGYIDGFNHEGTGVKRRGNNPYDNMVGDRTQVLAMKKIPGNPYDIYYSYYWDTSKRKWILYGCGKKYNDGPLKYISTGAFVEQPGPPNVQRSGHVKREIHFKGWLMDKKGKLYPIDVMKLSGKIETVSYKNWRKSDDGRFIMEMGGFDELLSEKPTNVIITSKNNYLPEYLAKENLADLGRLPIDIKPDKVSDITSNSATVKFEVDTWGTNPDVRLYWGTEDGLTFVEGNVGNGGVVKWQFNKTVCPKGNKLTFTINNLMPKTKYYYRLQVRNNEGEIWSWDTLSFTTK